MRCIKQEDYAKLNKALYKLEDLLGCMGVKEFSLSHDRHNMRLDTSSDNIDTDLLYAFCVNIEQIHNAKFGEDNRESVKKDNSVLATSALNS